MTPPSPLYKTQETTLNTRQEAQIMDGIKQARKDPVPNPKLSPMLSPVGHENANEDPQVDDHDEEAQEIIDPTPIPENKPRRKLTKIIYDRSPTKTPKRHGGRKSQPRSKSNIKNRLGQGPTKIISKEELKNSKIRIWSPWIQGQEPRNYVDYREYLEDQLRQLDAQNEEEGSSDTQTDDNGAEERE